MGIWTWVHLDLGTFVLGAVWTWWYLDSGTFRIGEIWTWWQHLDFECLHLGALDKGPSEMGGFHMLAHAHGGSFDMVVFEHGGVLAFGSL